VNQGYIQKLDTKLHLAKNVKKTLKYSLTFIFAMWIKTRQIKIENIENFVCKAIRCNNAFITENKQN